ncbi:MAG: hypothetical protein QXU32_12100 [Nitrososphaerales archaeon]
MKEQKTEGVFTVNRTLVFAGVFLVSMSGLTLEIAITRIFSAAIWYHHAFLAVSLALLGLGSSGLFLHFRTKYSHGNWAGNLAILSSISIAVSIPIVMFVMHALSSQVQYLPLFLIISAIPFFFIGLVIASAFNAFAHAAGKLYFADLIGASLGSLLVVGSLVFIGGESTALLVGVIGTVAAIIFARLSKNKKMVAISMGFLVLSSSLLVINNFTQVFSVPTDPTVQKDLPVYLREHPSTTIVRTEWNSFSRIDVVESDDPSRLDEGLAAKMFIDGGAGMNVLLWDGNPESRKELMTWMQYLPFNLVEEPKVLVIGSGGGRDVLAALASGSKDVTSVEINPIIFKVVNEYGARAGNIYKHPYVHAHVDEGRSFVTRSDEKYDVIYIPFVDTWASVSSGGLSLSENYLYTVEGFQEYYEHLSDRGVIVVVRWLLDSPRLVSTFTQLLEKNGVPIDEAERHLVVVTDKSVTQDPSITMVVFSKEPFTDSQLDFLSNSFARHGYKPILLPNSVMLQPYDKLFEGEVTLEQFYTSFDHRVHPVTDDSPYYLTFEKPLPPILLSLLYTSFAIVALFVGAPIARAFVKQKMSTSTFYVIPYFAALGTGFMLIEVALLQRLILLLGNPTSTLAILLFTLLLAGGAGSLASTRIMNNKTRNLVFVIGGIAAIVLLYAFSISSIISVFMPEPFIIRALASVAILTPLGFLLGMPFPTGMRITKAYQPANVAWMWAINGAFSVLGAVMATGIGIMYGLSWSMILGVVAYLVALGIAVLWRRRFYLGKDPDPVDNLQV